MLPREKKQLEKTVVKDLSTYLPFLNPNYFPDYEVVNAVKLATDIYFPAALTRLITLHAYQRRKRAQPEKIVQQYDVGNITYGRFREELNWWWGEFGENPETPILDIYQLLIQNLNDNF